MANSSFTMVTAGEAFISRKLSVFDEPEFLDMVKIIREADASFVNLETAIHKFQGEPVQKSAGAFGQCYPFIADELKWAGFDLISCANNHAPDYLTGGIVTTIENLERVGLVHAGTGMNLAEAREADYLDTKKGIVGLVAMASAGPHGFAGEQRPNLQGRPGVNPLRVNTAYLLDPKSFDNLKEIATNLKPRASWQVPAPIGDREFIFAGSKFKQADKLGVEYTIHAPDYEGNLKSIQDASRLADWVVVSAHYHENAYDIPTGLEPDEFTPQFVQKLAYDCIDAGADVFVGHGPHRDRGIEIYKGKPIFYSIGNFSLQSTLIRRQPQDLFEPWGLNVLASAPDLYETREVPGRHFFDTDFSWESFIAGADYDMTGGSVTGLKLYPITLGLWELYREGGSDLWVKWKPFRDVRTKLGRPRLADKELGKKIIDRIAKMSKPYGTEIEFKDGVGVVKLK
jgi:poly-gamma-glutamate synthesis protein (capsule biosynthesis protein)